MPVISESLMEENSWLLLQDFERCRLLWQWMLVAELLRRELAEIRSVYDGGTIHLKLQKTIPDDIVEKSSSFKYSEQEILDNVKFISDWFVSNPQVHSLFKGEFTDILWGVLSYSFEFIENVELSEMCSRNISKEFLQKNKVYSEELGL